MLILFQMVFSLFSLYVVFVINKKRQESLLGPRGVFFWVLFWLLSNVAVWWPNSTTILANALGIGRGTDLVLYISLAIIFFILFRLHIKLESVGRDITKVVREKAILKENNKDKK